MYGLHFSSADTKSKIISRLSDNVIFPKLAFYDILVRRWEHFGLFLGRVVVAKTLRDWEFTEFYFLHSWENCTTFCCYSDRNKYDSQVAKQSVPPRKSFE